jgi:hypothetical protein
MSRIAREIARPMLTALVLTTVAAGPASADGCWPCYRAWYPTMTQLIYDPPPLIYNRPCWGPTPVVISAWRARVIAESFPPPPPHWRYDLRTRAITLHRPW